MERVVSLTHFAIEPRLKRPSSVLQFGSLLSDNLRRKKKKRDLSVLQSKVDTRSHFKLHIHRWLLS